jgi:class 3 adenylate cyclase
MMACPRRNRGLSPWCRRVAPLPGDLGRFQLLISPGPDEVDAEREGYSSAFHAICTDCVSVTEIPETRYATGRDGTYIAYQVVGDGPRDLIYVPNWASPIDLIWEHPTFANFLRRLASFSRLVLFDKRGSGSSDHVSFDALATLEDWTDDIVSVMDAVGSDRAAIVGAMTGVPIVTLFAATYPERVSALVLVNPVRAVAYDQGSELDAVAFDREMTAFKHSWGTEDVVQILAPTMEDDRAFSRWLARFCRVGNPPTMATAVMRAQLLSDLRGVLPVVQAPTLVVQRSRPSGFGSKAQARLLAEEIRGARFVEVPGDDLLPYVGETTELLDEIESFLTGHRPEVRSDRVLATVLFTDIVDSTRRMSELGDRRWRDLLDSHDRETSSEIEHFRGKLITTTGDGVLATFDGPGRAIHCAAAIGRAAERLGLNIRAGLHTGEIEVIDNHIGGIAVHIAARIVALATSSEVLVSATVPPLVVGSGIEFEDRGEHQLKGVPGLWRVYTVSS